jgi:hypothetical protein
MTHGLSVEVIIPVEVTDDVVISIGERYSPFDDGEPVSLGEALQYAFLDPGGVADLSRLGVTWNVETTGRN